MTIAEKLRFLADRTEDEKEFYISDYLFTYQNGKLMMFLYETEKGSYKFFKSDMSLDSILWLDLKLKPQWEFNEDEKVILRNLPDNFRWIARDEHENGLGAYTSKPTKYKQYWACNIGHLTNLEGFKHLFQSVQWSDNEPCEFRKYL